MTFRERLADWISGGNLTNYRNASRFWNALYEEEIERANKIAKQADEALDMCEKWRGQCEEARDRLDRISAQKTPSANATVQRMARIARGEE